MPNITVKTFRTDLERMRPEIGKVLPEHVTPERFERVTMTAIQREPSLLDCSQRSLFSAVTQCASDGLLPDEREAALVKFGGKAAYMPMVAGLIKLARQSGEISTLTGKVVYEQDKFSYWIDDDGEHIEHTPELLNDPGQPVAVYALAKTPDGELCIEVMRVSDVEKVRKASRSGASGPWKDWWDQMAIKTAMRRLFKRLPRSTDRLDSAIHRDDQMYNASGEAVKRSETGPSAADSAAAFDAPIDGEVIDYEQEQDTSDTNDTNYTNEEEVF